MGPDGKREAVRQSERSGWRSVAAVRRVFGGELVASSADLRQRQLGLFLAEDAFGGITGLFFLSLLAFARESLFWP